jgi:hypothetical protein
MGSDERIDLGGPADDSIVPVNPEKVEATRPKKNDEWQKSKILRLLGRLWKKRQARDSIEEPEADGIGKKPGCNDNHYIGDASQGSCRILITLHHGIP